MDPQLFCLIKQQEGLPNPSQKSDSFLFQLSRASRTSWKMFPLKKGLNCSGAEIKKSLDLQKKIVEKRERASWRICILSATRHAIAQFFHYFPYSKKPIQPKDRM